MKIFTSTLRTLMIICLCYTPMAFAKSPKVKTWAWDGSKIVGGANWNTGNTQTTSIIGEAYIHYERWRWINITTLNTEIDTDKGETTAEKYFAQNQLSYGLDSLRKHYLYAKGNLTVDAFSPYKYQGVLSAGYGRVLIETDRFKIAAQAGPGLRIYLDRDDREQHKDLVLATEASACWQLTDSSKLTQELTFNLGSPYSYLKSVAALVAKVYEHFSVKIAFTLQYYTNIPENSTNKKKLDTTTNVGLVYTF